jgi:hypothetical protein
MTERPGLAGTGRDRDFTEDSTWTFVILDPNMHKTSDNPGSHLKDKILSKKRKIPSGHFSMVG